MKDLIKMFYNAGAIDVGQRDHLNWMNESGAEYRGIAERLASHTRYLPTRQRNRWERSEYAALANAGERCPGIEYPCGKPAPCEYLTATGSDLETARAVSLWYCEAHYAELVAPIEPDEVQS